MNASARANLCIDLAIFAGFLIATVPQATGETIHEWFGLAVGLILLVHLLLHWKWVAAVTRRFFDKTCRASRWNYLLNFGLFVAFDLIVFSGVMMSKSVLPFLGLEASHNGYWRWLHSQATNLSLLLVGLHVALHWKWIVSCLRRYLLAPLSRRFLPRRSAQPAYQPVEADHPR